MKLILCVNSIDLFEIYNFYFYLTLYNCTLLAVWLSKKNKNSRPVNVNLFCKASEVPISDECTSSPYFTQIASI